MSISLANKRFESIFIKHKGEKDEKDLYEKKTYLPTPWARQDYGSLSALITAPGQSLDN